MMKHNKNIIQYTIEELKSLVKKVSFQRQICLYHHKFGPKKYTQHQFVALLILYAKSNLSLRNFIKFLYESKWPIWLNLKDIPCKSSISNHFQRIGLTLIRELNKSVVKTIDSLHYALDATGVDSYQASRHYEKRINRQHRPYLKLSIIGQTKHPHLIEDFEITGKHTNDAKHCKSMLKRFFRKNKIIFADRGYDGENLHELAKSSGNFLYSPVRDFNVKKPKGKNRQNMIKIFDEDIYHERNNIETIMFLLKHKGIVIRAKKMKNKIKELAWKILGYNIERVCLALKRLSFIISLDKT
jgi:hypothetical protein